MKAPPQSLDTCWTHRDHLTGRLFMTIGVRDSKFNLNEVRYEVSVGDRGEVYLLKANAEVYTVQPGGSCDCRDNHFRKRPTSCKHALACHKAGFFDAAKQVG